MRYKTALLLILVGLTGAHAARAQSRCPKITVSSVVLPDHPYAPVKFKADVSGVELPATLTFNWSVSTGEITSGQGSNLITVDLKRANQRVLTATVEVGGLPDECSSEGSEAFLVVDGPVAIKKEEYGRISFSDEKKILLRFAKELRKYPRAKADVIYYAEERARAGAARWRARRARRYLIKAGIRPARIAIVDGGRNQEQTIELYIVR